MSHQGGVQTQPIEEGGAGSREQTFDDIQYDKTLRSPSIDEDGLESNGMYIEILKPLNMNPHQ